MFSAGLNATILRVMFNFPRPMVSALRAASCTSKALFLSLSILLVPGCGGSPSHDPEPPEPGDGVDPTVAAGPGEARAGRVASQAAGAAALFGGIASEGGPGDIKLYNSRVQVIIQGAYRSHGYVEVGGNIIDADVIDERGSLGRDTIDDLFLAMGAMRLFEAREVIVTADGSDGGPAVVRATGNDVSWSFIQGAVEAADPLLEDQELEIVVEYRLPPDSDTVQMSVTFTNTGTELSRFNPTIGIMASDEDLWPWAGGSGLDGPESFGDDVVSIGATGKYGEATLSIWPESGTMDILGITALVSSAGLVVISNGWIDVEPAQSFTMVRNFTVARDTAQAEASRLRAQGQALSTVSGQVLDSVGGSGVEGVRVHFIDPATEPPTVAGFSYTDAEGSFVAEIPPGTWTVYAVARGLADHVDLPEGAGRYGPYAHSSVNERQLSVLRGDASVPGLALATGSTTPPAQVVTSSADAAAAPLVFEMAPPGHLEVNIVDDNGRPLPAVIQVHYAAGSGPSTNVPAALRETLGIPTSSSEAAAAWTGDGSVLFKIPPGVYDVTVQHSFRHERTVVTGVEVVAGDVTTIAPVLEEVVALDGWMSMDSHLHASPSNDGSLSMEDRLLGCAATGVQIPVTTDHDRMVDYRPLATALGLDPIMAVTPGVEVSPVLRGHINLFPVEPDPALVNGASVSWWEPFTDTAALFEKIRATGTEYSLLQANHPRSGLFDFANLDASSSTPGRSDFWSWDFDMFELMNGKRVGDWETVRADWFGFLSNGHRKVPTGVSDSHGRRSPCGYARTDVYIGHDDPAALTAQQLTDALRAGHVVVSGGVTLRVTASDGTTTWLPGDTVAATSAVLSVKVSSPTWLVPDLLRLYQNGIVIDEVQLPDTATDGVWLEQDFPIASASDAWFVVEVEGGQAFGGVWSSAVAYAASNAFFLDAEGDGWQAPPVVDGR
jgi:hypothetical protein